MKQFLIVLTILTTLFSCEDVIQVDLDDIEPRLVVEANIEWEKGTDGNFQTINLSQSTNYFNEEVVPVTIAQVQVTNLSTQEVFPFVHLDYGVYSCNNFQPVLNDSYALEIKYNGEDFSARSQLIGVPAVTRTEQTIIQDFDGSDAIRFRFFANDQANVANYYYTAYQRSTENIPFISVRDDEFRDGNEIPFLLQGSFTTSGEKLEIGETIAIKFMGITEGYANYMELLLDQAYNGGSPFSSTPVQLKGNIINETNADAKPFGYFVLSQKETFEITIEQP